MPSKGAGDEPILFFLKMHTHAVIRGNEILSVYHHFRVRWICLVVDSRQLSMRACLRL